MRLFKKKLEGPLNFQCRECGHEFSVKEPGWVGSFPWIIQYNTLACPHCYEVQRVKDALKKAKDEVD